MLIRIVFTLTLFCSAFLSFSIQPILGKMLLPVVGGAPACWIVTMAFFQLALLGGYALSHILKSVSPFRHGIILLVLYGVGSVFLPIHIGDVDPETSKLSLTILGLLTKTILIPFMSLTATTSALLRIFSQTDQPTAQDPYYLFTASNAGSLIGLFIYPLALEPFLNLQALNQIWFGLYTVLIGLIILCVLWTRRSSGLFQTPVYQRDHQTIKAKQALSWFCLAFIPCSLSMGLSSTMTTDIANFPLIWSLPLGFYLLSFILGFARHPLLKLDNAQFMQVLGATCLLIFLFIHARGYAQTLGVIIMDLFLLLGFFFMICWSCHQTLAAQRPATSHLTFYYLIIALGGAVAGCINAFLVPLVLDRVIEFQISLILSLCLPSIWNFRILKDTVFARLCLFLIGLLCIALLGAKFYTHTITSPSLNTYRAIANITIVISLFILMLKPRALAFFSAILVIYTVMIDNAGHPIVRHRNFFGSTVVRDIAVDDHTVLRTLRHGNTTHGLAQYDANGTWSGRLDLSYYTIKGPLSDIFNVVKPKQIAIMGLGSGQLACFSKTAQTTYFEIDPDMVTIAENDFPYLQACPQHSIVLGDARIEFAKQTTSYDALILDVFSSDSIPAHIMTQEAISMYPKHLTDHGMIVFHTSNRYLDLPPQIAASARAMGLQTYMRQDLHPTQAFTFPSQWVAIPLQPTEGAALTAKGWHVVDPGSTTAWTDQRSSLLTAFRPIAQLMSPPSP